MEPPGARRGDRVGWPTSPADAQPAASAWGLPIVSGAAPAMPTAGKAVTFGVCQKASSSSTRMATFVSSMQSYPSSPGNLMPDSAW